MEERFRNRFRPAVGAVTTVELDVGRNATPTEHVTPYKSSWEREMGDLRSSCGERVNSTGFYKDLWRFTTDPRFNGVNSW